MKTWKRALALVLALVMALSLVALPSFAEGEDEETGSAVTDGRTSVNGLELRKVYDPKTSMLTLEAYATGSTTTTTSTAPVDIVLVLDVSGSMDENMSTVRPIPSAPAAPITTMTRGASLAPPGTSRRTTVAVVKNGIQRNITIVTTMANA